MAMRSLEGKQCIVALSLEYDAESVELGYYRNIMNGRNWGGFGPRFGIPRILDLLEKYEVKGTFFVPGWDAERYPESIREIARAGHEIAAHGYLHEDFSKLGDDEEKEVFEKAHKILSSITGIEPKGFRSGAYGRPLSPHTLRFVRDMGYRYDSSYLDDDVPYGIGPEGGELSLVEIPWAWILNDITFLSPPFSSGLGTIIPARTPAWILDLWKEEFDSLYEDVGFFNLIVHPTHIGLGSRVPLLEGILRFIRGYEGIRFLTYREVADLFLQGNFRPAAKSTG